jgi:hypothetical protein
MKGIQGIIVAVGLGLLGAALNWFYLSEQTRGLSSVKFIAVKNGIRLGEVISENHLMSVAVPRIQAENLKEVAYLYDDINIVAKTKATREYKGGELLLRSDYRTPRAELNLKPFERLLWVTVDSRAFVPELVDPGDEVTFMLPAPIVPTPAGASALVDSEGPVPAPPSAPGSSEMIGPFKIGSLGNRLGTIDVMRAGNQTPTQERQIGIIVETETRKPDGKKLEPNAAKLQDRLQRANYSNVGVILHPRAPRK